MIPKTCLVIETTKFPPLPGEDDEITNELMYGKALCQYLELALPKVGVEVSSFNNEDWGWWVEVQRGHFNMGLCIYSELETKNPEKYAIMPSIKKAKKWSWSRFRTIDVSKDVVEIVGILETVFTKDKDIKSVTRHDDFPF